MKWMSEDNLAYFWSKLKALLAGKKGLQTAVSDPTASGSGIEFIDSISQNANGEITATKKAVREASASQSGVVSTGDQEFTGVKTFSEVDTPSLKADWARSVLNTGAMQAFNVSAGSTGFVEICRLSVTGAYRDRPFEIGVTRRGDITPSYIAIKLVNSATIAGGTVQSCTYSGMNCFTVTQTISGDDNTISVWVEKNGAYDIIYIIRFDVAENACIGEYSFPGTFSATQPTSDIGVYPANQIKVGGATNATMDASSENPRITFAEKDGTQPVHILYTDYDSYRSPAGLKVIGGTSASPAWFEVEGALYTGGKISASGNIDAIGAGEHLVRAANSDKGNVDVMLDASSTGNVGVYVHGYWDGSAYVADAKWLIYRGSDGAVRLPIAAYTGSATRPIYISTTGSFVKCTDSSIALNTYKNTTNASSAAGTLRKVAGAVMGGGYVVTKVAMSQNTSVTLFTLPTGWRPSETVYGLGMCTTSGTGITVHIGTDGTVKFTSKWGALTTGKEIHFQIAFHTA